MFNILLLHNKVFVDYCPRTHGIWLDEGELEKLAHSPKRDFLLIIEKSSLNRIQEEEMVGKSIAHLMKDTVLLSLPNLVMRSSTVLISLYGLRHIPERILTEPGCDCHRMVPQGAHPLHRIKDPGCTWKEKDLLCVPSKACHSDCPHGNRAVYHTFSLMSYS